MKVEMWCPSRGRATVAKTSDWIPGMRYVVAEREAEDYKRYDPILHPNLSNLGAIRNWILDEATRQGLDAVVMIDDDITHIKQWIGPNKDARDVSGEEVAELCEAWAIQAQEAGAPIFGMNQLHDRAAYRQYSPFSFTNIILGPFFGVLLPIKERSDERIYTKEDYDLCLQVLNRARRILRFNSYCYVTVHQTTRGGCANYRTVALERKQFALLQKKWGSAIVSDGTLRVAANEKTMKREHAEFDVNPIVRVPIVGI